MRFKYNSTLVRYLLPKKYCAITVSKNLCLVRNDSLSPALKRHEMVHGEQFAREGWLKFVVKYLWQNIRYGYKNNKYEIEARKAEYPDR